MGKVYSAERLREGVIETALDCGETITSIDAQWRLRDTAQKRIQEHRDEIWAERLPLMIEARDADRL